MHPAIPILTAIAEPLTMMGASWKATLTNAGLAVISILFLGSVWSVLVGFVVFQTLAIYLTYRDCHFMDVMMAAFKCRRTPTFIPQQGHRYV